MPLTLLATACREAFNAFDTNESGEIDAWELRDILKGLGRNPTDEVTLHRRGRQRRAGRAAA
jgi:hypothetical protein